MALRDYAELDEDDFYGQGFGRDGVVSVWAGTIPAGGLAKNVDILQDLCGVGYYSLDNQEVNVVDAPTSITELLAPLSYSSSFVDAVAKAVKGKDRFTYAVVQYDFAYDPKRVKRDIAADPRFIGVFDWNDSEDDEDD
jgi:hypothetical protein